MKKFEHPDKFDFMDFFANLHSADDYEFMTFYGSLFKVQKKEFTKNC